MTTSTAEDYRWIPVFEAIQKGEFGDPGFGRAKEMTDQILADNPNSKELIESGAIKLGTGETYIDRSSKSGDEQVRTSDEGRGSVDWNLLPKYGPKDLPKGAQWRPVNNPYWVDPWTKKPTEPGGERGTGQVVHTENYGDLEVARFKGRSDPIMTIGRSLVIGAVTAGVAGLAAPALGAAFGITSNAGINAVAAGLKMIPGLATGSISTNSLYGKLAGMAGAATGIPGASQVAQTAWNLAQYEMNKP